MFLASDLAETFGGIFDLKVVDIGVLGIGLGGNFWEIFDLKITSAAIGSNV